jgi:cytoskeleton protein RodZ
MDDGVGATLREVRTRRKVDLETVEAATKIRVRYLRAIENEEWDVLPGETYARAFVRTYADYLGLDGTRLAEDFRRERGSLRPAERLPRVEQAPRRRARAARGRRLPRIPPRVLAVVVSLVLVAALVAIGLTSGGNGSNGTSSEEPQVGIGPAIPVAPAGGGGAEAQGEEVTVSLLADAEVWVCLLDEGGEKLIDGQILEAGAEAGPYRSGSFTVAFGNGEVTMTVNGKQASIPQTSGPIGFSIDAGGRARELPEGERPTCT